MPDRVGQYAPESVAHFAPENSRKAFAQKLNPFIQGLINYYHMLWQAGMRDVWNGLNHRLLKWVRWEKGSYKYASLKWLKQQYNKNPGLFAHWKLVHPSLYLREHAQQGSSDKEHEAPFEGRLSRTVLWEGRGEIPLSGSISGNTEMKSIYMKKNLKNTLFLTIIVSSIALTLSAQRNLNFQADLDSEINEHIPGVLVTVICKEKQIDWSGASGYADKENKIKLTPNQTFRMASVTKTFVASAILRLWEDKKLNLEDPIIKYISKEHSEILIKGGYAPEKITILHLLTHSSGMADHTQTEKFKIEYLKTNHIWTRTEQLLELIGQTKPVGEIGKQFSYSDTGYILLGEIIENITQKSLGEALGKLLNFKKLDLNSIRMEDKNGEFDTDRIHQYYMDGEDTYFINPTFDLYGGGGLLSSTRDLALFYKYLFENKVFRKKSTLKRMLTPINYSQKQALEYRMGIWETEIEGLKAYTHSGFWGTQVIYIPNIKTIITANYSQRWTKKGFAPIIPIIVKQLMKK